MREQLEVTAVALMEAKREIKRLMEKVRKMEGENMGLQTEILSVRREDMENLTSFKMSVVEHLL